MALEAIQAVRACTVDDEGVRNVLTAIGDAPVRALMTAIGVTNRDGSGNRSTEAHDGKRRSERLVWASGQECAVVRPGWFDDNAADQHALVFLPRCPRNLPRGGRLGWSRRWSS